MEANAVLPQGAKPKTFSVNAVMRASGRGRTQLYTEHKDLVAEIEQGLRLPHALQQPGQTLPIA